jgi:CRP/FNR family transcriptional regulator, dissimilatory nitrate respiration regulator
MKNNLQIIAKTPLFEGLALEEISQIHRIAENRTYKKGETIFLEGDRGDGFYIITDGKVKIFKVSSEGKEQILHIYGPGHPFGEVPVFSGKRFPANALALEKSRLLFFPRAAFLSLVTENPNLAMNLLAVLSMRLREFTVQIENLSLKEVPGRLASYLLYLAEEQQTDSEVDLDISKGQLASLLGTIPETLSRIFAKMTTEGLIDVVGRRIRLLDRQSLAELSETGKLAI